jgi:hypothetical protein
LNFENLKKKENNDDENKECGEWIFLNKTIGKFPKLIHVPTHFFKIVFAKKKQLKNNNNG